MPTIMAKSKSKSKDRTQLIADLRIVRFKTKSQNS